MLYIQLQTKVSSVYKHATTQWMFLVLYMQLLVEVPSVYKYVT